MQYDESVVFERDVVREKFSATFYFRNETDKENFIAEVKLSASPKHEVNLTSLFSPKQKKLTLFEYYVDGDSLEIDESIPAGYCRIKRPGRINWEEIPLPS